MTADRVTDSCIARGDVTLQRVGREAILHDARSGQAHVINASAARVWDLCDGRPLEDLLVAFAEPYGLAPDAVRADVERVLDGFRKLGLFLEPASAP
jgi:PqqD family protein of HPr-rel-A system